MAIRSFLAFELPHETKRAVAGVLKDVRNSGLNARWVKVDNIHLTVIFIGNIGAQDVPAIGDEVKEVSSEYAPFHISLRGLGVFPNPRRPRVLWVGLDCEIERMTRFRDDLQNRLKPFGLKEEKRSFRPHLTLGRFREPVRGHGQLDDLISRYSDFRGPVSELGEFVFFQSLLKPGGAEYSRLGTYPLKGRS